MRIKLKLLVIIGLLAGLFVYTVPIQAQQDNWQNTGKLMRLLDRLDRPEDGYCLDVLGSGRHIRFDMPMTGHNCKPGLYADEAVTLTAEGLLYFPAYGLCVTAMGVNRHALPGAALMLKRCGENGPFLRAAAFQSFTHLENGQVQLNGSELCIVTGDQSRATFDPTHRWRSLFLDSCSTAAQDLSRWEFVRPES